MSASAVSLPLSMNSTAHVTYDNRSPASGFDTTTSYEQSRRQVSSVVISKETIGDMPESGGIRYVEVPVIEEVIRHVPRREVVEVEKIVPKYEYEYVERVVEVPQIQYVDRTVEKQQIQENIVYKTVKQVQEVPREVVRTIPKIEHVVVEKVVNVPGQVIEVPKPYVVENKIAVKRYQDKNMPVVVAQTIRPVVTESNEVIDVDVYEYEPQVIPVDVHVAKPVASHLVAVGATQEIHQLVNVPAAQYNSILRSINAHLGADVESLPYIREGHHVPFLSGHEMPGTVAPVAGVEIHNVGTVETSMSLGQITQRDGGMMTTTGSIYQGGHYQPTQNGSVVTMGHEQMETTSTHMTVPPVYPNVMTREVVESVSPSVAKTQSHYNKSHKSGRSFAPSQPAQHKRRGCQC